VPVVGTAGHVDHGKSTLIEALTGRDPDRWEEEKSRGLTIDLGFGWATLDNGIEISFVDVPGHERYLKNMLAGIEAIDVALFVVAADEGWMPQSEEHLAVIDLLGINRGVVALTKVDKVDDDLVELATLEISDRLVSTSLAEARIIPVSAQSGAGMAGLRAHLADLIDLDDMDHGRPRMWIDRSFTISGAGTVVTGTLLDGSVSVGDQLELLPAGVAVRVRGIQSHEAECETIPPRRRVALNLAGLSVDEAPRGSMLGIARQWTTSNRFTASVSTARYIDEISPKGAYQIHLGSAAYEASLQRIEDNAVVIRLQSRVPLRTGDRFIIRDTGRRLVVGGGQVLDPNPGPLSRALENAATIDPDATADDIADALLAVRGRENVETLAAHSGGGLAHSGQVFGSIVMTVGEVEHITDAAIEETADDNKLHPLRPGLSLATLSESLGVDLEVTEQIVALSPQLLKDGPDVSLVGHTPSLGREGESAWERARKVLSDDLAVPRCTELGLSQEQVHLLVRTGQLIQITPELVFLPEQVDQMVKVLRDLPADFTVAGFRDASGLSRKYAVPFLEWTDKEELTVRRGDTRHVR
jgi:selenocysteine-specific elongation factor